MCGITGIVNLRSTDVVDESLLRKMNARLRHRGPDGDGFHTHQNVGLGHRRLSIIDLEGGKQPLYNEDHTVVTTYNGEIYNFQVLENELKACGHVFRSRCDTEVIVHAWEEWGPRCVERFNGMFAFALWDQNQKTLFLARDRLGVKPLYYAVTDAGEVVFASELKAILVHPGLSRALDPRAVEEYFTFGYVPDPKTIFASVKKLEPGCTLTWRHGEPGGEIRRYWDVPLFEPSQDISVRNAVTCVASGLKQATANRLIADVPLGAFLSGGIDSSAVVAMMAEISDDPVLTCSIGFDEPRYDETQFAKLVADTKKTNHYSQIIKASAYELLDKLVDLYDEPYADSSALPTFRVCEMARQHVTVALSGDAGDECFIGYRRYRLFAMEQKIRSMFPDALRKAVFTPLGKLYPKLDWAPRFIRGKTTFQALARDSANAYLHGVSICSSEMRADLFSSNLNSELQGYESSEVFKHYLDCKEFEDPLRMVQYLDYKTYLPGDILTKVDRASMGVSLEVRAPFLDYEYVEQMSRLPTHLKLHGGEGKFILKKAMESMLPHKILYRKKMGFAVPLDSWFRDSLKDRIRETLRGDRLRSCGMFSAAGLDRILDQHVSGRRDHAAPLWSLLMFDGFLRTLE